MTTLPAHLLPVLRLKVQGYPNQTIADELGYSIKTIETYVKRIILFFKSEGLWDPQASSRTGLPDCGRRYLETLAVTSQTSEHKISYVEPSPLFTVTADDSPSYTTVWKDLTPDQIEQLLRKTAHDPYEAADLAISLGNRFYRDWLCTDAIPVFQMAEKLVGVPASQAARAACSATQMHLELGDLRTAKEKITQAQRLYALVVDLETRTYMQHLNGWIEYYQGNFDEAEAWYLASLDLLDQKGLEHFGQHAHHFLGRIYCSRGQLCEQKQQADEWFHKAEGQLDTAYHLHHTWGDDGDRGYDLLRMAQLRRAQRRWREARQLRERARHLFNSGLYYLSIDLEESYIAMKNREEREAMHTAEKVLEGWSDVKRTKGVADALRIIGDARAVMGHVHHALEDYVAALCIYPYPNYPSNRQLWQNIAEILRQADGVDGRKQIQRLTHRIEERQGAFAYLNSISVDRHVDIAHIVDKLGGFTP